MINTYEVIFSNGLEGTIKTRDVWGDAWAAEYTGWGLVEPNVIGGYEYPTEESVVAAMTKHLQERLGWKIVEVRRRQRMKRFTGERVAKRYVVYGIHFLDDEHGTYESYEIATFDTEEEARRVWEQDAGEPEEPVLQLPGRVIACAAQREDPEDQIAIVEVEGGA